MYRVHGKALQFMPNDLVNVINLTLIVRHNAQVHAQLTNLSNLERGRWVATRPPCRRRRTRRQWALYAERRTPSYTAADSADRASTSRRQSRRSEVDPQSDRGMV